MIWIITLAVFEKLKNDLRECFYCDNGDGTYSVKIEANYRGFDRIREKIHSAIGRNDSCPCGSGQKFKKCCL